MSAKAVLKLRAHTTCQMPQRYIRITGNKRESLWWIGLTNGKIKGNIASPGANTIYVTPGRMQWEDQRITSVIFLPKNTQSKYFIKKHQTIPGKEF